MRLMKRILSSLRKKWSRQASVDLFVKTYGLETAELLGLKRVSSDAANQRLARLNAKGGAETHIKNMGMKKTES